LEYLEEKEDEMFARADGWIGRCFVLLEGE
jgi:hypothetical protein